MENARTDISLTDELMQLKQQHGDLDRRLREIEQHVSLTSEERLEVARLKKEKLRAKDRIAQLSKMAGG